MANNILYIGSFEFPDKNASAIRVKGIAKILTRLDFKVHIGGNYTKTKSADDNIFFWSVTTRNDRAISSGIDISPIVSKVEQLGQDSIKAIIAYNYTPIAFYKLQKYCKREGIVLIPDITEWSKVGNWLNINSIVRTLLANWRIMWLTPRCKNAIFATNYMASKFTDSNTLVLPFVSSKKAGIKKMDSEIIKFIYAGNPGYKFSKDKLDLIIEAFSIVSRKHNNFSLQIVGITKDEILKYKGSLGLLLDMLADKVRIEGHLTNKETISLIREAHYSIFLRPIDRVSKTGFPTKVLEAFEQGTPCITNVTSDLSDYISDSENGFLFENLNSKDISRNLCNVLSLSKNIHHKIQVKCASKNPFSEVKFINRIDTFFQELK